VMETGQDARAVKTGAESTRPKVYLVYFGWYSDYAIRWTLVPPLIMHAVREALRGLPDERSEGERP